MKRRLPNLWRRYRAALRAHLRQGRRQSLKAAQGLGSRALTAGLRAVDLARSHEQILVEELLSVRPTARRAVLIKRAGAFFAVAIAPIEREHRGTQRASIDLTTFIRTLSQRAVELAVSNQELSLEIAHRKTAEQALKKSERHYARLLDRSDRLQEQLRRLSRRIMSAQEEERKRISRELHDVIVQTLTGINLRLVALKTESADSKGIQSRIASTQRLVEHSVGIIHRFARELRPAVLDDLGLIPALHSFMRAFTAQTGVRTQLTAFAGVERLDADQRTVLFRVAQEALTNVSRHAQASHARVKIERFPDRIRMRITDDGKSFEADRVMHSPRASTQLGLLGMRERLEMVGGRFGVESAKGKGTTIEAVIPLRKPGRGGGGDRVPEKKVH